MATTMYQIRVAGVVPPEDLADLGAVTVAPAHVSTVLYGISDEAALFGLLSRLRSLGIEVVEVHRVPAMVPEPEPPPAGPDPPASSGPPPPVQEP
jgi:hypothetical protein